MAAMQADLPTDFPCLRTHTGPGGASSRLERIAPADLSAGEVLIRNRYAGVNYKDCLSILGRAKIIESYPRIAGIEAVGDVVHSTDARFVPPRVGADGARLRGCPPVRAAPGPPPLCRCAGHHHHQPATWWRPWAWVMARPSASAASLPGRPGSLSRRLHHLLHLGLAGFAVAGHGFFICSAVYSATGRLHDTSAVTQAPRAWPSSRWPAG
jgi:NADPH:quinone reductase-like Zn-dependent oxidoreductase